MKIIEITSFEDKKFNEKDWCTYEGYTIKTDEKEFHIAVENQSCCCEDWGHISSEDNFEDFIGADILDYRCVEDADYNEIELTKKDAGESVDVYDCAFIDFDTSKGKLQFAVYNHHNGYYGHDIKILQT